jgi:hypothetical protein
LSSTVNVTPVKYLSSEASVRRGDLLGAVVVGVGAMVDWFEECRRVHLLRGK